MSLSSNSGLYRIHTYVHTHMHTLQVHTRACMHAHTYTHTCAHTHTYTRTHRMHCSLSSILLPIHPAILTCTTACGTYKEMSSSPGHPDMSGVSVGVGGGLGFGVGEGVPQWVPGTLKQPVTAMFCNSLQI